MVEDGARVQIWGRTAWGKQAPFLEFPALFGVDRFGETPFMTMVWSFNFLLSNSFTDISRVSVLSA